MNFEDKVGNRYRMLSDIPNSGDFTAFMEIVKIENEDISIEVKSCWIK
ncbi:MAG: hypothetical protein HN374_05865 [Cryomorphaceae bacterium]|nr:hypothetical protein [Cryomorphaceae bacterium]